MSTALSSPSSARALPARADVVIRAAAIYSMRDDRSAFKSLAIRDERIVAVSSDPHGLDSLALD